MARTPRRTMHHPCQPVCGEPAGGVPACLESQRPWAPNALHHPGRPGYSCPGWTPSPRPFRSLGLEREEQSFTPRVELLVQHAGREYGAPEAKAVARRATLRALAHPRGGSGRRVEAYLVVSWLRRVNCDSMETSGRLPRHEEVVRLILEQAIEALAGPLSLPTMAAGTRGAETARLPRRRPDVGERLSPRQGLRGHPVRQGNVVGCPDVDVQEGVGAANRHRLLANAMEDRF